MVNNRLWIFLWRSPIRGGQRGSITVLMAGVAAFAGVLIFGLAQLGGAAVSRAQARTAADAGALAAAAEGREAAEAVVKANGGRIVSMTVDGAEVQLVVEVGDSEATARARREVLTRPAPGPGQLYEPPGPR